MNQPTIKEIEEIIDLPTEKWVGNCYFIACECVSRNIFDGIAVYGHFLGEISPKSQFWRRSAAGFVRHGWILLENGDIIDPTRWVFEGKTPYIYYGQSDGDYDEGGNELRAAFNRPSPKFNPGSKRVNLDLNPETHAFLMDLCENPSYFNVDHVFWVANSPYNALIPHIKAIYECLFEAGYKAAIPIDNWRRAVREYKIEEKSRKCL